MKQYKGCNFSMVSKMIQNKKKIFLVTANYPAEGGDSVFVYPELRELIKEFDVTVICTGGKTFHGELEKGVSYFFYKEQINSLKKILYLIKYPFCKACRKDFLDICQKSSGQDKQTLVGRIRKSIEFYACGEEFYKFFIKKIESGTDREEAVFYTFWYNAYSLPMLVHRKQFPDFHLITRLHGYDLYNERYLYGRQPFKKFMNNGLEKLYFVAALSQRYYWNTYTELSKEKTEVRRLGVYAIEGKQTKEYAHTFLLVSCSNLLPLKRVNLIVEALSLIAAPIHWVHFGGGIEMKKIQDLIANRLSSCNNVKIELMGEVRNEEVRRFYEDKYVDCFITTSSTEGSPVSVMEAMAARIPIIATPVGELPIMIDGNGILLEENPAVQSIAEAIIQIMNYPDQVIEQMRRKSFKLWKDFFEAEKNAAAMVESIRGLFANSRNSVEVKDK